MKATTDEIKHVLHLLAETSHRFSAIGENLNNAQLQHKPDAKSWSANEILAHLRACADVWGDMIEAMLTQDKPTLRHLSPRTYIRKTDYAQQNFHDSLSAFGEQRSHLLDKLSKLELADWSRAAMIKERQHIVFTQARRMALHEVTHCEQIEALVANL